MDEPLLDKDPIIDEFKQFLELFSEELDLASSVYTVTGTKKTKDTSILTISKDKIELIESGDFYKHSFVIDLKNDHFLHNNEDLTIEKMTLLLHKISEHMQDLDTGKNELYKRSIDV